MDTQQNLDRIEIVLVGTQDGANIGAVCRAMKSMGLSRLSLVTEREYSPARVRTLAIHAMDLWENRTYYPTLKDALKNSVYSVAATRRRGKFRKGTCISPEHLAEKISGTGEGKICIVFGRESDGLTDSEVNECSDVVTIPTSEKFPSLNLSQAVQVICYTLFSRIAANDIERTPVTVGRINESINRIIHTFSSVSYFKHPEEKEWTSRFLRDIFVRADLSEGELQKLEKSYLKSCTLAKYKKR